VCGAETGSPHTSRPADVHTRTADMMRFNKYQLAKHLVTQAGRLKVETEAKSQVCSTESIPDSRSKVTKRPFTEFGKGVKFKNLLLILGPDLYQLGYVKM